MTTVRELIQALVMNCELDDTIEVEIQRPVDSDDNTFHFEHEKIRRVFHLGNGESLIECHDD